MKRLYHSKSVCRLREQFHPKLQRCHATPLQIDVDAPALEYPSLPSWMQAPLQTTKHRKTLWAPANWSISLAEKKKGECGDKNVQPAQKLATAVSLTILTSHFPLFKWVRKQPSSLLQSFRFCIKAHLLLQHLEGSLPLPLSQQWPGICFLFSTPGSGTANCYKN